MSVSKLRLMADDNLGEKFEDTTSEAVNRRRTDLTMAERKSTNGQSTSRKTLHNKLKIEQHDPNNKIKHTRSPAE